MRHGSLFSGIGGFDLAAEWMGWENVFHCEIDPFCNKILNYYWPNAKNYTDIKETDFREWNGKIDIISGGFPCQPFSLAGKRKGTEDDRHLWPEMLRAIREIQPSYVLGENVYGLVNWSKGLVFEQVQIDLENEGYEVTPVILPACAVNAPHRRDRIWFVAYASNLQRSGTRKEKQQSRNRWATRSNVNGNVVQGISTNTGNQGLQGSKINGNIGTSRNEQPTGLFQSAWQDFPTQSPICSRNDGLSPKLDGITISKHRNESIKGFGNSVVPQLVYQIFKTIEQLASSVRGK